MTHDAREEATQGYSLLFDVYVLGQEVKRLLAEAMAGGPLRPEDYAVYSVVFEEEAVTPTAMSRRLALPLTTVMEFVHAMEARGHARRIPNPRDGRSYLLVLTSDGRRAHREANLRFEAAYARFAAALPIDARDARRVLAAIRSAASVGRLEENDTRTRAESR